jgi:hypothetical protein
MKKLILSCVLASAFSGLAHAEDYAFVMAVQPRLETTPRLAEKCQVIESKRMVPKSQAPIPEDELPVNDGRQPVKRKPTPTRQLLGGVSDTLRAPWSDELVEATFKQQVCKPVQVSERQFQGYQVFVRYLSRNFNFTMQTPPPVGTYLRVLLDNSTGELVPVVVQPQAQARQGAAR